MQGELKKKIYPKNPLGIIALFVFFIEAISTISLKFMLQSNSPFIGHLVWFIILYPSVIVMLFFVTLWWKRETFYGPGDFRDDSSFVNLFKKVERLEVRQEASQLDPEADIDIYMKTIKKLVEQEDYYAAIQVGRSALKESRFENSYEVFKYLEKETPKSHDLYTRTIANLAYSLIGLKKYEESIKWLLEVWKSRGKQRFYAWHACALAYSYYNVGNDKDYKKWLKYAKGKKEYRSRLSEMAKLYPEIKHDLFDI